MPRIANASDIPFIVACLLDLKETCGWAGYIQPGYNQESITSFVRERMVDPSSCIYREGQGFIGVSLSRLILPPNPTFMYEWGWVGTPREAVACWNAATLWAKDHGATLTVRYQSAPGTSTRRFIETAIWEVI